MSFLPALNGRAATDRSPMIHHAANGRFAIRQGECKMVMDHGRDQRELYDLSADPSENNNIIDQHADIAADLAEKITAIVQNGRSTPGAKQPNDTPWWSDLAWIPSNGAADAASNNGKTSRKKAK